MDNARTSPFHQQPGGNSQLVLSPVAVEKLGISEIRASLGDGKCLGDPRRSFVGHPDAILFLRFLRGVSFSTATPVYNNHSGSANAKNFGVRNVAKI